MDRQCVTDGPPGAFHLISKVAFHLENIGGPYGIRLKVCIAMTRCFLNTYFICQVTQCGLGWFKNAFSSETEKFILETTFSHYLGLKQYRKPRIENFYAFFHPVQAL